MRDAGWDVAGVDLSSEIIVHASQRFGLSTVYPGTLDSAR